VTYSPEGADCPCITDAALPCHDRHDGNDMIGIGGVTHAEKETQSQNAD
jgi:hypothetical protein